MAFEASLTLSSAFKPLPANFPPLATLLIPKEAKSASSHPAASMRLAFSPVSGSFPVVRRYVSLTEENSPIIYGIFLKPSTVFCQTRLFPAAISSFVRMSVPMPDLPS